MHFFRDRNEGGIELRAVSHFYGISVNTLSNYIRHVAWLFRIVLSSDSHAKIQRSSALGRREMEVMIAGFAEAIFFFDGPKFLLGFLMTRKIRLQSTTATIICTVLHH